MVDQALNTKVHDLLLQQIENREQTGTQVSAWRYGEEIVNTWAGRSTKRDDAKPIEADSLFSSFSTTKGVAALALHILADRGEIEYDVPVAKYWPEFAQHGKGNLTVAQAMSHQGGLHAVPQPYTADTIADWDYCLDWIANAEPAWEPGTATGYHAMTYGWIVGGIIQKATGRHIQDVVREDIAEPLGIADEMFIGIPDGVEDRLTTLIASPPPPTDDPRAQMLSQLPQDHDFFKAMPPMPPFTFNDIQVRKACLPAANGHFTAHALGKMYGALANGGEIEGVRLVSPERIASMQRLMTNETDRVLMMPIPKSIGFMMGGTVSGVTSVFGPRTTSFGHSGAGGSSAFADPEVGLSIAVTLNQMQNAMQGEGPTLAICEFIRGELGVSE